MQMEKTSKYEPSIHVVHALVSCEPTAWETKYNIVIQREIQL